MTRLRPRTLVLLAAATAIALLSSGWATAAAPAKREAQIRVVGGTTPTRAWPAQGYLEVKRGGDRSPITCGATLVSARWVLTAAHCVTNEDGGGVYSASSVSVALGNPILEDKRGTLGVSEIRRHPSYAQDPPDSDIHTYDLALLRLEKLTPPSPTVEPMRLVGPADQDLWRPGAPATIIGWGKTCNGCPRSRQLLEAQVPIVDDAACASAHRHFRAATMTCAGDGNADTCNGDSGGPLMVPRGDEMMLVGITSWGVRNQCASAQFPGVYARLGAPELNDWVRAQVPTAAIDVSPSPAFAGQTVQLTATATQPPGSATPSFQWDLDSDGEFDDWTGPSASLRDIVGSSIVRVRASYGDEDLALAREVVTPLAAPSPSGNRGRSEGATLGGLRSGPSRVRIGSLLDGRLRIRVFCTAPCTVVGSLSLDWRSSLKLGLTRKVGRSARLGGGDRVITRAGVVTMTLHLSKRARKAIRRVRRGTLRLALTVRTTDAVPQVKQTSTHEIRLLR